MLTKRYPPQIRPQWSPPPVSSSKFQYRFLLFDGLRARYYGLAAGVNMSTTEARRMAHTIAPAIASASGARGLMPQIEQARARL